MSIVENRKAFHDYFIEERFEAGLALEGWEVKAIRAGRANLKEAYVVVKNQEIVNRLVGKVERAGYTLAPINLHYRDGRIKLEIGLAKGKKQFDKRATIKEREWNREQQRLLRVSAGTGRT
jgi:SsrA-binding protein